MGDCSTNLLKAEKLAYDDREDKFLVPDGFKDVAHGEKGVTRKMCIEFVTRVVDPRYSLPTFHPSFIAHLPSPPAFSAFQSFLLHIPSSPSLPSFPIPCPPCKGTGAPFVSRQK
jgi:hypothetical protein